MSSVTARHDLLMPVSIPKQKTSPEPETVNVVAWLIYDSIGTSDDQDMNTKRYWYLIRNFDAITDDKLRQKIVNDCFESSDYKTNYIQIIRSGYVPPDQIKQAVAYGEVRDADVAKAIMAGGYYGDDNLQHRLQLFNDIMQGIESDDKQLCDQISNSTVALIPSDSLGAVRKRQKQELRTVKHSLRRALLSNSAAAD